MAINIQLAALAVVLWVILVHWERVAELANRVIGTSHETVEQLHWRKEFVLHAAFLGTAAAAFMGFTHDSFISKVFALVWFAGGLWYSRKVANRIFDIEEHERRVHWRKLAGMIRSVVQSEIERDRKNNE